MEFEFKITQERHPEWLLTVDPKVANSGGKYWLSCVERLHEPRLPRKLKKKLKAYVVGFRTY